MPQDDLLKISARQVSADFQKKEEPKRDSILENKNLWVRNERKEKIEALERDLKQMKQKLK